MSGAAISRSQPVAIPTIKQRVAAADWPGIDEDLDAHGCAIVRGLLLPKECASLTGLYSEEAPFRSRVVMSRHGFGRGEYKYFSYPLPDEVAALRTAAYSPLAAIANRWQADLRTGLRFPEDHAAFIRRCHRAGQTRPTPLLLRYGEGDYNCLHQDLYGESVFPLQITILLSQPGQDFTGGEFVLTEQRPRMQSRLEVVPLALGDAVIFPVDTRPARGSRGMHRVRMRHGVSRIRSGLRYAAGIIFHDAK